jgi:hypothetical protein
LVAQRYLHIQLDEAMVWLGDVSTQEDLSLELLLVTGLHCGVHSRKGNGRIGNDQPKEHTQPLYDEALTRRARVTNVFHLWFLVEAASKSCKEYGPDHQRGR